MPAIESSRQYSNGTNTMRIINPYRYSSEDDDDVVGHWPMDTTSNVVWADTGTEIKDTSGNANHGATTNMDASNVDTGPVNSSLDFNGTDEYITISDSDDLSFGDGTDDNPFTIEFWYDADVAGGNRGLILKGASLSSYEYYINTNIINTFYFVINDKSAGAQILQSLSIPSPPMTDTYIKCTYDGSGTAGGMKVYFDDVLQSTTPASFGAYTAMENSTDPLTIGKFGTWYFNGSLAHVKFTKGVV